MTEIWMNENWREEQLPPKTKRLYADAVSALMILESNPETFDFYCLLYLLHGNKTKQWGYSTNRSDVIGLMTKMLQVFLEKYSGDSAIEFNFSYPRSAIQNQISGVDSLSGAALEAAEQKWVVERWKLLLETKLPELQSFNPRTNSKQKALTGTDPPGIIEIRLRKSLGILMAFRCRGERLVGDLTKQ